MATTANGLGLQEVVSAVSSIVWPESAGPSDKCFSMDRDNTLGTEWLQAQTELHIRLSE